ncbi:MAG: hypothetical protein ACKORL_03180, partial [Phycisphaerales bacterium]
MSEERTIDAGPRRLERLRERHGAPVRAAPCAIGAIAGGLVAAWAFGVPGRLLGEVSEGLRIAGHAGLAVGRVDGASEVRSAVGAAIAGQCIHTVAAAAPAIARPHAARTVAPPSDAAVGIGGRRVPRTKDHRPAPCTAAPSHEPASAATG